MSGIKDQEKIDELRKRLYERGNPNVMRQAHGLSDVKEEVPTSWEKPPVAAPMPAPILSQGRPQVIEPDMAPRKQKRNYRVKILIAGFAFFVLAMAISSLFLAFGRNSISGENITITASGPFTIGGGEELQMQVGITNANAVAIESATLIVEYPDGTQSSTEEGKELHTERLALETINKGETMNIPLRARVFGEENQEKIVNVSVEYRVQGSNATFFKEAEPLRFKISSSPIIVRADTLKKISSGQETDVTLTIISNSPTPLSQLLVKAEYPTGFDFSKSDPSPDYGQNMWLVENLEPEKEQKITITGIVIGKETDEYAINFTVGVPNEREQQTLASIFATTQTQFQIEQPFLDIELQVDNSEEEEVAAQAGARSSVNVEFTNTLEDSLYDLEVEVQLSGNAFSIYEVGPSSGYFDSSKNTITWNVANTPSLRQLDPGDSKDLSFTIEPRAGVSRTPQININVNAEARRVSENDVAETLVGTASSILKVIGSPSVLAQASHNNGTFVDSGPLPPVKDMATTYTITLAVENDSNEITNAVVNTSLPQYMTWLDKTAGSGEITFNPTTRSIEWAVGDVDANAQVLASFQVSLFPLTLQVGTIPTLISEQRMRAVDRFTGAVVRDTNPPITTQFDDTEGSGRVRASEND
jgi:hypothetical protein